MMYSTYVFFNVKAKAQWYSVIDDKNVQQSSFISHLSLLMLKILNNYVLLIIIISNSNSIVDQWFAWLNFEICTKHKQFRRLEWYLNETFIKPLR